MLNLDPAKLLVIAVVAIILLGPDRLPQLARQIGAAWRSFNEFRHRMEAEVRHTMPDLPPTSEIARLARSPSALLDHLSSMSDGDDTAAEGAPAEEEPRAPASGEQRAPAADAAPAGTASRDEWAAAEGEPPASAVSDAVPANGSGPAPANGSAPASPPVRAQQDPPAPPSAEEIVLGDPNLN